MIIEQIKGNFQHAKEVLIRFISDPETWEKLENAGMKVMGLTLIKTDKKRSQVLFVSRYLRF